MLLDNYYGEEALAAFLQQSIISIYVVSHLHSKK
jgi:hypothetical protein